MYSNCAHRRATIFTGVHMDRSITGSPRISSSLFPAAACPGQLERLMKQEPEIGEKSVFGTK